MSRQTELMALSESTGPKRFRFYLQNASKGNLLLRYAPEGWENAKFLIKRNEKYYGMFRTVSVNELTFDKDARDYIRDVYELQGINATIIFTVDRLNSSHTYVEYYSGKIDLSTYRIEETGVKVGIIDNSLTEKIKNRESLSVNLRNLTSIGGFSITPFADENPRVEFPEYLIQAQAVWSIDPDDSDSTDASHYCPLLLSISEFTEAQSQTITGSDPMFLASTADRDITLTGRLRGQVYWGAEVPHTTFYIDLYVNGVVVQSWPGVSVAFSDNTTFDIDIDESFTVSSGQDFSLRGRVVDYGETVNTVYTIANIDAREDIQQVDSSSCIAYPYYEALLRVCQVLSDSDDCFKSDFFGRTDTPIVTYGSDGQLGHLTRGLFIRNSTGLNDTIAVSLSDLFASLSKLFMLGMGVELVSGKYKVVVEAMTYFFSATVVCNLSGKLRDDAISKEVAQEWIYTRIKSGFNSYEYPDSVDRGTLAEFNTKSEFSTVISALDNELDLVNKFRADTSGMISLRVAGPTADSEKGDEDIFLIDSVRKLLAPYWTVRTDEGFSLVTGGIDADQWYNLDYSPKRSILRHGVMIRPVLERYLNSYLRWQTTDKNTLLSTQLSTEASPVVESDDILADDLDEPMWYPEVYDVELDFDDDDLQAILNNPKGLVKLSQTKYGWILNLEAGSREKKATMRLLRCNINYVTPIES